MPHLEAVLHMAVQYVRHVIDVQSLAILIFQSHRVTEAQVQDFIFTFWMNLILAELYRTKVFKKHTHKHS